MLKAGAITAASIADLSITTIKLAAGILSADVAGRAKMATGYFTEAKATDAFAASAIPTAKLKRDGTLLTADATGRGLMAANLFDGGTVSSVVSNGTIGLSKVKADLLGQTATITVPGGNGVGSVGQLFAAPVTLLPAAAGGTFYEFISAHIFYDWASAAYDAAAAGDTLEIGYAGGAAVMTPIAGDVLGAAVADVHILAKAAANVVPTEAAALVLRINSGSWYGAAGDSPLKIEVTFRVRNY
jgi:hypothetical protein